MSIEPAQDPAPELEQKQDGGPEIIQIDPLAPGTAAAEDERDVRIGALPREQPQNGHEPPYIAFEHVSKSFGSLHVLDDVSFFVNAGEILCILGRSGVGKSVSLQQIMGFLKPDRGSILVAGENICGYTEEHLQHLRKKVTMVFQNGALFDSMTVFENVAFPAARARHACRRPDCADCERIAGHGRGRPHGAADAV